MTALHLHKLILHVHRLLQVQHWFDTVLALPSSMFMLYKILQSAAGEPSRV